MAAVLFFCDAIRNLHRAKNASYGIAWKKRGEVMSIMSNIARKVDRLDNVASGAPDTLDESLVDTAADLFIYALKYQTYLADQAPPIAAALSLETRVRPPYSEGVSAFEVLLALQHFEPLVQLDGPSLSNSVQGVLSAFAELEACFAGQPSPLDRRLQRTRELTRAAVDLLGALKREMPASYEDFVTTHYTGTD